MKKELQKKVQKKQPQIIKGNPKKKRYPDLFMIAIIVFLGILVYSNSFKCSFQFDDYQNIVDNPKIKNLSNVSAWWNFVPSRPLGNMTFALNYHFNKTDVKGYHAVNFIIHIINALLIFWLVVLIFSSPVR